jgi:hypothetical protein
MGRATAVRTRLGCDCRLLALWVRATAARTPPFRVRAAASIFKSWLNPRSLGALATHKKHRLIAAPVCAHTKEILMSNGHGLCEECHTSRCVHDWHNRAGPTHLIVRSGGHRVVPSSGKRSGQWPNHGDRQAASNRGLGRPRRARLEALAAVPKADLRAPAAEA